MPRLSAPTQVVFFISLTLAIAALIAFFVVATHWASKRPSGLR